MNEHKPPFQEVYRDDVLEIYAGTNVISMYFCSPEYSEATVSALLPEKGRWKINEYAKGTFPSGEDEYCEEKWIHEDAIEVAREQFVRHFMRGFSNQLPLAAIREQLEHIISGHLSTASRRIGDNS